jgi:hypothetical protein
MTNAEWIASLVEIAGYPAIEVQEDGGWGFSVWRVGGPNGVFSLTIDTESKPVPSSGDISEIQ